MHCAWGRALGPWTRLRDVGFVATSIPFAIHCKGWVECCLLYVGSSARCPLKSLPLEQQSARLGSCLMCPFLWVSAIRGAHFSVLCCRAVIFHLNDILINVNILLLRQLSHLLIKCMELVVRRTCLVCPCLISIFLCQAKIWSSFTLIWLFN